MSWYEKVVENVTITQLPIELFVSETDVAFKS